jgi:hypothetical protein
MARQKHRGQHAKDAELFHPSQLPALNAAIDDMSYLLNRGYSDNASLVLVGDHYQLHKRQRMALLRACSSDEDRRRRQRRCLPAKGLEDQPIQIDGYNLLITVESMLAGGIILHCRDGCYRDIASVHGTYRRVEETLPALVLIGKQLQELGITQAHWYLDAPVSNSGRLKTLMHELAADHAFPWDIELVNNPDKALAASEEVICLSSDGWVIDQCQGWFNFVAHLLPHYPEAEVVDIRGSLANP